MCQVKKSGMPPGPRAGFSMCVHKKRAVLFGGVVDMEVEGEICLLDVLGWRCLPLHSIGLDRGETWFNL